MDSFTSGATASALSGTKFKIHQSVPSGSIKCVPDTIVRAAHLNDCIEIKRKMGEGSKPLFAHIPTKPALVDSPDANASHDLSVGSKSKTNRRSSSTESSSPERYRNRENKKHSPPLSCRRKSPGRSACNESSRFDTNKTDKYRKREKSKTQKLPYYRGERRERHRLYGTSSSRSPSPTSVREASPNTERRIDSPPRRRRSTSRERRDRYSPHRSSRRLAPIVPAAPQYIPITIAVHTDYTALSFLSKRRRRSTSRERRDRYSPHRSSRRHYRGPAPIVPAAPQYIPITIAVPTNYTALSFESSSPERYRHRENKKHSPPLSCRRKSPGRSACNESSRFDTNKTDKYRKREKSKTRSLSPVKKKPTQKLPYFRDERRERHRLYGTSSSRNPEKGTS